MSEAEVTFVNGVAESQTTEGESAMPADDRAAAIAAVREAIKKEGESAAKEAKESVDKDPLRPRESTERDESGRFLKKPVEASDDNAEAKPERRREEPDEDSAALKRQLAERKAIAQEKARYQQEFQRQQAQMQAQSQRLAQQEAAIRAEAKRIEMLRKDPLRAIKENGWDPEQFILDIANDGTPEGQARRRERERDAELQEMRDWRAAQERAREEQQKAVQEQQKKHYRSSVEQEFLKTALDTEKHPNVASFYSGGRERLLLVQADDIADQYRAATTDDFNPNGKEASFADIAEYLEECHDKWYRSRNGSAESRSDGDAQVAKPVTQGKSTRGSATGRTLNPNQSGERRTLGTNLADLDGDERREAAIEAVRVAMRASGEKR